MVYLQELYFIFNIIFVKVWMYEWMKHMLTCTHMLTALSSKHVCTLCNCGVYLDCY